MGPKRLRLLAFVIIAGGLALVVGSRWTSNETEPVPVEVGSALIPRGVPASVSASAEIASITDGDTLRLVGGTRIRLLQIDAPERGECFARNAGAMLARLAPRGAHPDFFADKSFGSEDDYGRLLLYVVLDDRVVNLELVRQGAAVPYFYGRQRGVYADELMDAVGEARREHRGLWGACPGAKLDPNRGALTGPA